MLNNDHLNRALHTAWQSPVAASAAVIVVRVVNHYFPWMSGLEVPIFIVTTAVVGALVSLVKSWGVAKINGA